MKPGLISFIFAMFYYFAWIFSTDKTIMIILLAGGILTCINGIYFALKYGK